MKNNILFLILIFSLGIVSCDGRDFVYIDQRTFQRQLSYLKDGFVEVVYQLDPTEKGGYKIHGTPWPILKEKRFAGKIKISDEIIQIILNATNNNQRYLGRAWYPTYQIIIKHPYRDFYLFNSKKYLRIIFDFKNSHIFIEGRSFVLTEHEAELLKEKLEILLGMNRE